MKTETREKVAFMAASLFDLAEMTESDLSSVIEVVGTDAIQELMGMDHLRYECSYDRMAEEICNYIDWDPMLVMTGWTYEDLSRIGQLIADLVEGDVVYNQTLKSFYHGNLTPNDRLMVHGSDATHAVAELSDAENLAQYDNMEPCVYISPGNRPHIIQYCCYADCDRIDHTYGVR